MSESNLPELLDLCPCDVVIVDKNFNIRGFSFKSIYRFLLDVDILLSGHPTTDITKQFLLDSTILLQSDLDGSDLYVNRKLNFLEPKLISQEFMWDMLKITADELNSTELKNLATALKIARKVN